ncbi:hypothetical protein EDD86DRAFT_208585, partial [Gorgonomyces haynaldii]
MTAEEWTEQKDLLLKEAYLKFGEANFLKIKKALGNKFKVPEIRQRVKILIEQGELVKNSSWVVTPAESAQQEHLEEEKPVLPRVSSLVSEESAETVKECPMTPSRLEAVKAQRVTRSRILKMQGTARPILPTRGRVRDTVKQLEQPVEPKTKLFDDSTLSGAVAKAKNSLLNAEQIPTEEKEVSKENVQKTIENLTHLTKEIKSTALASPSIQAAKSAKAVSIGSHAPSLLSQSSHITDSPSFKAAKEAKRLSRRRMVDLAQEVQEPAFESEEVEEDENKENEHVKEDEDPEVTPSPEELAIPAAVAPAAEETRELTPKPAKRKREMDEGPSTPVTFSQPVKNPRGKRVKLDLPTPQIPAPEKQVFKEVSFEDWPVDNETFLGRAVHRFARTLFFS